MIGSYRITRTSGAIWLITGALLFLALGVLALFPAKRVAAADCSAWMDTSKTPEERANALLDAETQTQQMRWLVEQSENAADPAFCIPQVVYTDGPWGINSATGTTAPPIPLSQAAT